MENNKIGDADIEKETVCVCCFIYLLFGCLHFVVVNYIVITVTICQFANSQFFMQKQDQSFDFVCYVLNVTL